MLNAIVRRIRETNGQLMVTFKRGADTSPIEIAGEDLAYMSVSKIDPAGVGRAIGALHDLAGARPLLIEFGEEFPSQEELVASVFGFGAAGVVACARRPAVAPGWQNIRMLNDGELLPFAYLNGSAAPLPAVTPLVSVVVIARDDERTIEACLESIGRLQYPNYEVIVIDEGSRDRSAEIAAATRGVRLVRNMGAGFDAARIEDVCAVHGHLIAFTRADCTVDSDWLTIAVRAIGESGFDGCSGPIYWSNEERRFVASVLAQLEQSGSEQTDGEGRARLNDCNMRNMIIRKPALRAVGGLRSRLNNGGASFDLCARLFAAGMTVGWSRAALVWQHGHRTIGEFFSLRIRQGQAEAMLASMCPRDLGGAKTQAHREVSASRLRLTRRDRDGASVVTRILTTGLSSMGAIVRVIARRHYTIAAVGADVAITSASDQGGHCAQRGAIENNRAQPAHSVSR